MSGLRAWAMGHWLRSIIIASAILMLIGITIGGWAYLASVALKAGEPTAAQALLALDEKKFEDARHIVTRILSSSRVPTNEYGVPLLVLGCVKMHDAEQQSMPDRRRGEYLIASRYLTEARVYGLPGIRELQGSYYLGKCLIESGQFDEGIRVLDEIAQDSSVADRPLRNEALTLLTDTCLLMPSARVTDGLHYNDILLGTKNLSDEARGKAFLQRAECLARLERFPEAKQALSSVPVIPALATETALTQGRILLDEFEAGLRKTRPTEQLQNEIIKTAIDSLLKGTPHNELKDAMAAEPMYEIGRGLALQGKDKSKEALEQFQHTRQRYADTEAGLAAQLGEANLLREAGNFEEALPAYRHVLESYAAIPIYRSRVLPVDRMRAQFVVAVRDYLQNKRYTEALSMLDNFAPLFSREQQLELRGTVLESWGADLLSQATDASNGENGNQTQGMERLRAAGVAFEQLAALRFASREYTTDLWRAAENFFQGHCYSRAVAALTTFLDYEPEVRNAQALLRLGQAQLALGKIPESISAFEECLEFHPLDAATYQARLDCAKAYWRSGKIDRAEELLRENIAGSSLKPASPEWKDSKFELGMLLHQKEKFEDAINELEDAIERYPDDPQRLTAQYVIGECYRRWAQESLKESQQTRAGSEHDKWMQQTTDRLNAALRQFEDVQRTIALKTHDIHKEPLLGPMLRNCYMQEGAVLFDLATLTGAKERYQEAIEVYSNVSSLYPDEPFALETFVQIANCWRRRDRPDNARKAIDQARMVLERLPPNADFSMTTVLSREEWRMLLNNMSNW